MNFLGNIPDLLYKYRNWNDPYHKRTLTHSEIYLASPDQFNDPFDATLPFRYRDEDLSPENIFIKLRELALRDNPNIAEDHLHALCFERQMSGAFDNGQYWKDQYEDFTQNTNTIFGILSLTSKNDNLLMWSHYANCHTGFCVGIDKYRLYETTLGQIGPVIYSSDFPLLGIFEDPVIGFTRLLTTKSPDWSYEDEYRITKVNASRTLFQIPDESIREIVLGLKMTEHSKEEIIQIRNKKFPHAQVFQSNMNLNGFKLDVIPIFLP